MSWNESILGAVPDSSVGRCQRPLVGGFLPTAQDNGTGRRDFVQYTAWRLRCLNT